MPATAHYNPDEDSFVADIREWYPDRKLGAALATILPFEWDLSTPEEAVAPMLGWWVGEVLDQLGLNGTPRLETNGKLSWIRVEDGDDNTMRALDMAATTGRWPANIVGGGVNLHIETIETFTGALGNGATYNDRRQT